MKKIVQLIKKSIILALLLSNIAVASSPEWLLEPNATESTAVRVGNLVFISGQASGDSTNTDNNGTAIEESLETIRSIAKKMGGDMKDIIKLDIYLTNFDADFPQFDTIFPKYFTEHYPTRTAVGVSRLSGKHTVAINAVMTIEDPSSSN
jgi:enamine deaminase RidA (YjgF/YER057c/UK114 family)